MLPWIYKFWKFQKEIKLFNFCKLKSRKIYTYLLKDELFIYFDLDCFDEATSMEIIENVNPFTFSNHSTYDYNVFIFCLLRYFDYSYCSYPTDKILTDINIWLIIQIKPEWYGFIPIRSQGYFVGITICYKLNATVEMPGQRF